MQPNIYLTSEENKALKLLAEGYSSQAIKVHCDLPLAGYGVFTQRLRLKTGIRNHRDMKECKCYMQRYAQAMASLQISPQQVKLLRMFLTDSMEGMASRLGLNPPDFCRLLDSTLEEIAIFTEHIPYQKMQTRIYLAAFHMNGTPPKPHELQIIRHMVTGLSFPAIADALGTTVCNVKTLAKDVCYRLGFHARGRDVQRALLRGWLLHYESQEKPAIQPPTMDDPLF